MNKSSILLLSLFQFIFIFQCARPFYIKKYFLQKLSAIYSYDFIVKKNEKNQNLNLDPNQNFIL